MALFFPRLPQNPDFAPFLRSFLDDSFLQPPSLFASTTTTNNNNNNNPSAFFNPKFDLRESTDAYELEGELPGVEAKNLEVRFESDGVLVVKGRTESKREEGVRPSQFRALDESGQKNLKSRQPSVEDEEDSTQDGAATPTSSVVAAQTEGQQQPQQQLSEQNERESHYWVSERSVGEFRRSFRFPGRVDQENVKASLKDGILKLVVPKKAAEVERKIVIE